ncbi:MAG: Asp23/Gls24 family envelope stress response protein, partial [Acidimicrobiia bacterium]|nr:Asp23/Gls24 family envelope stress response protein [Acidimicrobiia bacterium]
MGAGFRRLISRIKPGGTQLTQGVNVEVGTREAAIDLVVLVRYGYPIPALAQQVRENVIARIESDTGLMVKEVNIEVDDLVFETTETEGGSRVE